VSDEQFGTVSASRTDKSTRQDRLKPDRLIRSLITCAFLFGPRIISKQLNCTRLPTDRLPNVLFRVFALCSLPCRSLPSQPEVHCSSLCARLLHNKQLLKCPLNQSSRCSMSLYHALLFTRRLYRRPTISHSSSLSLHHLPRPSSTGRRIRRH
jgi:hypothetical protein